jgi:RNA polymerase sigma factor (sigma-70 family)
MITQEDNESLVAEYQATKSNQVFEKLVAANKGIVMKMAISFSQGRSDLDDYIQEGWIALERAAMRFDPDKKSKFITFATWVILNQMTGFYKKNKPKINEFSLDSVLEPSFHDRDPGIGADLDYYLGLILPFQRKSIMKVYFSDEKLTRSDHAMAGMGRRKIRKLMASN